MVIGSSPVVYDSRAWPKNVRISSSVGVRAPLSHPATIGQDEAAGQGKQYNRFASRTAPLPLFTSTNRLWE
jgi:hypothetical protein